MSLNNAEDHLRGTPGAYATDRRTGAASDFKASVTKVQRREVKMLNDRYFAIWLQGFLDYAMGKLWKERFIDDDGRPPPGWKPTEFEDVLVRESVSTGIFAQQKPQNNVVKIEDLSTINEAQSEEEKAEESARSASSSSSSSETTPVNRGPPRRSSSTANVNSSLNGKKKAKTTITNDT